MFRIQFLHLSPLGPGKPMEETEIPAEDLASAAQALSQLRPWPCDADAFRIVDASGREVLAGTNGGRLPSVETHVGK